MKIFLLLSVLAIFGLWKKEAPAEDAQSSAAGASVEQTIRETAQQAALEALRTASEKAAKEKADAENAARETATAAAKAAAETVVKDVVAKAAAEAATAAAAAAAKAAAEETAKTLTDEKTAKEEEKENLRQIDTRVFRLNHASAAELAEKFNEMWNGEFGQNWKVTRMAVAFQESNAIMITAPRVILNACERMVAELDVEARHGIESATFF